jgi:uncharacterized cupredoxin-like copper-binding protein
MRTRNPATRVLQIALIAAVPALTACAEKSASGDAADAALSDSPAAAKAPRQLDVVAHNYTFDGLPDTLEAGATTIRLTNGGPAPEMHHVAIIRLGDGHTAQDLMAAVPTGKLPAWAEEAGGPNVNSIPGQLSVATVELTPGNYLVVCFVPGPDGVPHIAKGMARPLTVIAATGEPAALPAADVRIDLADYNFAVSPALTAGHHVVEVSNAPGTQSHEVIIVRLEPGKTPADVVKFVETMDGPPPAAFIGGVSGVSPAFRNTFEVDLTPGEYALICLLPDATDGKMHAAHGMTQTFTVS